MEFFAIYLAAVLVATIIGMTKNRPGAGLLLGLCLGLIGAIIAAFLSKKEQK